MHWLGVAALVVAAGLSLRWTRARFDTLGRPRPFPWLSTLLLVAVGLAALTPWYLRQRLEERLSDAASVIVGDPVDVECQSFGRAFVDVGAEFGYVAFSPAGVPEKKTLIKREQCRHLRAYLASDKLAPSDDQIVAVHTLTHEAIHMSGITNEAETECLAVQRDADMATAMGASHDAAQTLAVSYWSRFYPRMPDEYRSRDCGGPTPP